MPPLPVELTIDNTLGAVLVGFAVSCCAYGVLMAQTYFYFSRYPSDRHAYKFLVILIMLLETLDQAFIGHVIYYYSISNFADVAVLLRGAVTWSFILQQTSGAIVGGIVKTSFSLRVWRFSHENYFITAIILLLTWGSVGVALAFTVKSFQLPDVFAVVKLRVLGTIALGVELLTDFVIAASLCYFLSKLRTGYKEPDTLVRSLVRYAVNTGALTSAVSLTTLTLYNLMPSNLIFVATYFLLSKLYAISFMATLNTRRIIRGSETDRQGSTNGRSFRSTNVFPLGTRMSSRDPVEPEITSNSKVPSTNTSTRRSAVDMARPQDRWDQDTFTYPPPPPRTLARAI